MRLLILDACVLIDFCEAEPTVLRTLRDHVGPLHVAAPVFDEVRDLDQVRAQDLGLVIVEPSLDEALEAGAAGGALSFQDWLCLLIARREGFTCVTNDKRMRAECAAHGVETMWGLELLALAVDAGALSIEGADTVAAAMIEANPYLTHALLQRFRKRIGCDP